MCFEHKMAVTCSILQLQKNYKNFFWRKKYLGWGLFFWFLLWACRFLSYLPKRDFFFRFYPTSWDFLLNSLNWAVYHFFIGAPNQLPQRWISICFDRPVHSSEWFSHTNFGFLHWFSILLEPESIRNYEENKQWRKRAVRKTSYEENGPFSP